MMSLTTCNSSLKFVISVSTEAHASDTVGNPVA